MIGVLKKEVEKILDPPAYNLFLYLEPVPGTLVNLVRNYPWYQVPGTGTGIWGVPETRSMYDRALSEKMADTKTSINVFVPSELPYFM